MPSLAGDLQLRGNVLLEAGKYDEAKQAFERGLKTTLDSNLSQEIKDNTKLFQHYNLTRVALGKKDLATAKTESQEFRKGAEASKNPAQVKQAHELAGLIATGGEELRSGDCRTATDKPAEPSKPLSPGPGLSGQR